MPSYIRNFVPGGTYFFTVVTHERQPWLRFENARQALRLAIQKVRNTFPFTIDAWVLLPDHVHCIWTLPDNDKDFSTRWRLIKTYTSKQLADQLACGPATGSRLARRESNLWQRRFWEHTLRDEMDYNAHCDYIHYNPVKHSLCASPHDWEHSTFHRFFEAGIYHQQWGSGEEPLIGEGVGKE